MASLNIQPTERRLAPRRIANSRGVLIGRDLEMVCLISDLSDGGFRVRLDRAQALPPTVVLIDIAAGTACETRVAWSKGLEAGLRRRSKDTPLKGLVPARFTMAREAWLRAGGR
jgi:TRAP-type mannitol/chloroaromatic compound transport system substrate-binding protein